MQLITIEQARQHCRADGADDAMLELYGGAAEEAAQEFMNRKVFPDAASMAAAVLAGTAGCDARSENWVNSTEVGATASGTAGLDLSDTADVATGINADSVTVSGNVFTLNNATITDADGKERPATSLPVSWTVGAVLTLKVAATFTATTSGLYSIIAGSAVAELAPYVGMPVLLTYNGADYALFVASYTAGEPAVPGVGGSPARLVGSAAASNFDFSGTPATFGISWRGTTYSVALVANYITLGVLLTAINDQLVDSGLVATQSGGVVTIAEAESPYAGGNITYSGLPASVFGSSPTTTTGVATTGGTPATQPRVTLAYDGPGGTAFGGLPPGSISLAMSRGQSEYRIASKSGFTLTVQRLTEGGVVDTSWPGWVSRTATDYRATGFQEGEEWLGPFLVCPSGETTETFEYDFNFPGGLIWYTDKGNKRTFTVTVRVAYDGVDVTYIDEVTWAAETVECRLPGVTEPWKVEAFELQGVGKRDRAYRIGMRRLMKHQGQRLTYKTKTEMMGLVYQYGDRVKLFDDIPGSSTTSAMIESASLDGTRLLIEVGEYLDWSLPAPRCLVRFQDGTLSGVMVPTRVDEHRLTIAASALPGEHAFNTWIMDDPTIDPPELIFCDSTRAGYDAVLAELTPGEDGSVELTALQYDPVFYQYDDATAP